MSESKFNKRKYFKISLFIYLFFLGIFYFLELGPTLTFRLGKYYNEVSHNFILFSTITTYVLNFEHYNLSTLFYNIFGNVLIFVPLGILVPSIYPNINRYLQIIYISFLISVTLEGLQYITSLGVFDIDDIILNVIGGILGFYIYRLFWRN